MDILTHKAVEIAQMISSHTVSVIEVAREAMDAIEKKEPEIHSFITIRDICDIKKDAKRVQELIDKGKLNTPLAGVPIAIKDNICTKGIKTTCASHILDSFIPPYSADAADKLIRSGAIIIGKTNMDEFAMGSTTETSYYGITKNPLDIHKVAGGSSGGSAAAVASGEAAIALGTDTGGSIRQPCAYCGLTGIKPTYGTVSRYGLIAYSSSMDQIGPIAKDVTDATAVLSVISGHDMRDSTSLKRSDTNFMDYLLPDIKGMRVGVLDYEDMECSDDTRRCLRDARDRFLSLGANIKRIESKLFKYLVPAYYIIACAEAESNLARYDGVRYGYRTNDYKDLGQMYEDTRSLGLGFEVKKRIMLGAYVLSDGYYEKYYQKAQKVRSLIIKEYRDIFKNIDIILSPVVANTPPKIGDSLSDPMRMYRGDIYTVPANLAGLPAVSLPCGYDTYGMPVGIQLMAGSMREDNMIRAAYAFERSATL